MLHTKRLLFFFVLWLVATATAQQPDPAADQAFQKYDTNHDGHLDPPEFTAGYQDLQQQQQQGSSWLFGSNWFSSVFIPKSEQQEANSQNGQPPKPTVQDKFWKSFSKAVAMIVATEIGDKTFFIAAVLSMKHDRSAVFSGAIAALIIMTILSTAMGVVLPNILPRQYTHLLSALLFLYFGFKLLAEGNAMAAGKTSDELEEVEEELLLQSNKKADGEGDTGDDDVDAMEQQKSAKKKKRRIRKQQSWLRIALQALSLTFVAEWGDRSQIATIALAASHHPLGVTIGGCLGHSFCTGMAVLGGRMLAASISERTVHLAGGSLFLLFGVHSLFWEE